MSFLDNYIKNAKLSPLDPKIIENLRNLEEGLNKQVPDDSFQSVLGQYTDEFTDLIIRFKKGVATLSLGSVKNAISSLRFLFNIGIEVVQIVESIADKVTHPGMTNEDKHNKKVEVGKDMIYFVWKTVDPFSKVLRWLPFKKTLEKAVVRWISGKAIDVALDLLEADKPSAFKSKIIRALP